MEEGSGPGQVIPVRARSSTVSRSRGSRLERAAAMNRAACASSSSSRDLGLRREPVPGVDGAIYSRLNGLPGQAPRVQALDR